MNIDELNDQQRSIVSVLLATEQALRDWEGTLELNYDDRPIVAWGKGRAIESINTALTALFEAWNAAGSFLDDPVGTAAMAERTRTRATRGPTLVR